MSSTLSYSQMQPRKRSRTLSRTSTMVITTISFSIESSRSSCCKLVILSEMVLVERVVGVDTLKTSLVQSIGTIDHILYPWRMLDRGRTGPNSSSPPYPPLGSMTSIRMSSIYREVRADFQYIRPSNERDGHHPFHRECPL